MLESSGKSGEMMRSLLLISLLIHSALAKKGGGPEQQPGPKPPQPQWLTLSGNEPLIVARGGLSGLFPESSGYANSMGKSLSLVGTALFCNLQLTKDNMGICLSNILLDNTTTLPDAFPKRQSTYKVNGKEFRGWFALDFTAAELTEKATLTQNVFSRPSQFDNALPIATIDDVFQSEPDQVWLHVPYDAFYSEHKINVAAYVQKAMRDHKGINFISSPEIGFLKTIGGKVNKAKTKLIFEFLSPNETEPTTRQDYGALLKNLGMIKSLAAGILVPKEFIYPITPTNYLDAPTTLVADAHKEGLEVYAKGFTNDIPIPYNYSMDPTAEIQQFVDNDQFSVDGVVTDFPPTASEAIACFSHNKDGKPYEGSPLIISRNGASGDYPGCTDLAYQHAIDDGADIIDCSVQMSSDGVAFCLDGIDLNSGTNALSQFMTKSETIPELQPEAGVFSFQLTWEEIQSLKPQIESPFGTKESLFRNPAYKDAGKLVTLNEFLELAKKKATTGILINIRNAPYLASKAGLDIVGTVASALKNATLDQQSTQKVIIRSDDTSVLSKFADAKTYKRVFSITEKISAVPKESIEEIKKFADGVTVNKASVILANNFFIKGETKVVKELQAANLSVYIDFLKNEFTSLMFDYLADPIAEIATYAQGVKVDGIITDFPQTASKFMRSPCTNLDPKANIPYPILPIEPGSLLNLMNAEQMAPAEAPLPPLDAKTVVDPPLPPVSPKAETKPNSDSAGSQSDSKPGNKPANAPAPTGKASALTKAANWGLSLVAIVVFSLLCMGN